MVVFCAIEYARIADLFFCFLFFLFMVVSYA